MYKNLKSDLIQRFSKSLTIRIIWRWNSTTIRSSEKEKWAAKTSQLKKSNNPITIISSASKIIYFLQQCSYQENAWRRLGKQSWKQKNYLKTFINSSPKSRTSSRSNKSRWKEDIKSNLRSAFQALVNTVNPKRKNWKTIRIKNKSNSESTNLFQRSTSRIMKARENQIGRTNSLEEPWPSTLTPFSAVYGLGLFWQRPWLLRMPQRSSFLNSHQSRLLIKFRLTSRGITPNWSQKTKKFEAAPWKPCIRISRRR